MNRSRLAFADFRTNNEFNATFGPVILNVMRQHESEYMGDTNGMNPYSAPSPVPKSAPAATTSPPTTFKRLMSCIVVVAFLAIGHFAFWAFIERQWMIAFLAASAALMCIPLVDHSAPVRQKLAWCFVMPFAVSGLACFVLLYFQMFHIAWFEAVFNNDGLGPLGLIGSAIAGLIAGGFVGCRVLKFLGWGLSPCNGS